MKKILTFLVLIILCSLSIFAFKTVITKETNIITRGNGICEEYSAEFGIGDKKTLTIDGTKYEIEFLGTEEKIDGDYEYEIAKWKMNGVEGEGLSKIYTELSGEEKSIIYSHLIREDDEVKGGSVGIEEENHYPFDCIGFISKKYHSKRLMLKKEVTPGWNLIPRYNNIPSCNYATEERICEDDILVEYVYNPLTKKYYTEKDIERYYEMKFKEDQEKMNKFQEEQREKLEEELSNLPSDEDLVQFSDLEFLPEFIRDGDEVLSYFSEEMNPGIEGSSKWIYVTDSGKGKYFIQDYYRPERKRLTFGVQVMFKGWNFISVGPEYMYNEKWQKNQLRIENVKGDCEITSVYMFDNENKEWVPALNMEFEDEDIGRGMVIKTKNDCRLGLINNLPEVPDMPN